ncbi:MAG: lipid-A-disaccharide synthase [Acidobacteriota bacterium]
MNLLIVAGEASGDLHGARLLSALKRRRPDLAAFGLGGRELEDVGLEPVADVSEITVVGLVEVLRILERAKQILATVLEEVDRRQVSGAVLIDFSGFNLRLAQRLHERGIPIVYFVSPQVWAWRKNRVKTIARTVSRMLVLFPFEEAFYREHGVQAEHVGHPLVDEVPQLPQAWDIAPPDGRPLEVSLLPGSRNGEVRSLLPVMLDAVGRMAATGSIKVNLIEAPSVDGTIFDELLADFDATEVERVRDDRFRRIADSHLALCASGTATLEVGLLTTPMLVLYRLAPWTYWIARTMVRLPHVCMVNLVLDERVVPELIQGQANGRHVAEVATALVNDREAVRTMRTRLSELRPALGDGGSVERAATATLTVFEETR